MDQVLLAKIANYVFLQSGDGITVAHKYDVDWKTLAALVCTCKALRAHLNGVRQLFHNLQYGPDFCDTKALPKRWGFNYSDLHQFQKITGVLGVFLSPIYPFTRVYPRGPALEIDVDCVELQTKKPKFKRPSLPQPRPRTVIYRQTRARKRARD